MPKLALRLLILSLVILTALQVDVRGRSGAANADSPPNLAPNPSFELAQQAGKLETTAIAGWTYSVPFPGSTTPSGVWDGSAAHAGSHSVSLTGTPFTVFPGASFCALDSLSSGSWLSNPFPVSTTTGGYSVSLWSKTTAPSFAINGSLVLQISYFDAQDQNVAFFGGANVVTTGETSADRVWTKWSAFIPSAFPYVSPTAKTARLRILQSVAFASGPCPPTFTTWIDDISLTPAAGQSPLIFSIAAPARAYLGLKCGEAISIHLTASLYPYFGPFSLPAQDGTTISLAASRGSLAPSTVQTKDGAADFTYTAPSDTGGPVVINITSPQGTYGNPILNLNVTCVSNERACLDPARGDTVSTWHWNANTSAGPRSGELTVTKTAGTFPGTTSVSFAGLLDHTFSGLLYTENPFSRTISTYAGPTGSDAFLSGTIYNSDSQLSGFITGLPVIGSTFVSADLENCVPLNGKAPGPNTYIPAPPGSTIVDPPAMTLPTSVAGKGR
jgi:hypothetical protein